MKITVKQLRAADACEDQVKRFEELFGSEVVVTKELCLKHCSDFDFDWIVFNLLPASAWKAYNKARASARKAYYEATALAFWECIA